MLLRKRFLFFGVVIAMLVSSCRNKELEQANKELNNSSVILNDMCRYSLFRLGADEHKSNDLIIGKEVDSVFQKVIEKDTSSADYIIQNYDSLVVRYGRYLDGNVEGIDKNISYQTAKNKLLQLKFQVLNNLDSKDHGFYFLPHKAIISTIQDSTIIIIHIGDKGLYSITMDPNTFFVEFYDESVEKDTLSVKPIYTEKDECLVIKTAKLPKGKIGIYGSMVVRLGKLSERPNFSAIGYNE